MTVPGISVISPSYGPQPRTSAAEAVLPKLHALLGPFLVAPAASAPPEPDPRALMQDGAERVEAQVLATLGLVHSSGFKQMTGGSVLAGDYLTGISFAVFLYVLRQDTEKSRQTAYARVSTSSMFRTREPQR